MRVLIACECSQTVCAAFRALGDECYSCDTVDQYGGHPEWHIRRDVLGLLDGDVAFTTQDGTDHYIGAWDLIIAHPPCTYLSLAQNGLYDVARMGADYVAERMRRRDKAIRFFLRFARLQCPSAIENPPGCMSTRWRRPDQVVQPYEYGDPAQKATCLWLHRLPRLIPTNPVDKPPVHVFPSSNSMSSWYYETSKLPAADRARVRSKTFPGIARAMATQWHAWLSGPFRLIPDIYR